MRDPGFRQSRSSSSRSSSSSFNHGAQRVLALKQPSRVGRSYENCCERDVLMQCHSLSVDFCGEGREMAPRIGLQLVDER
jgi:hypothetical protein